MKLKQRPHLTAMAGLAVVALLAGGCSGASKGGNSERFEPKVATTAPEGGKSVDSITWNVATGEPDTLDPALSATESVSTVVSNLCEPLMRWNHDYQQEPALASSVDHPDDTTWTFHLRQGVKFWDGTAVTADDVVYSIKRVLDPALASSWTTWALGGATITSDAPDTVTIRLPHYGSAVEGYFATPAFAVVSKAYAERAGKEFGTAKGGVMCTGPYKLDTWKSGQSITLTANADYWDAARKPKVQSATFTFVTDPSAQSAALLKGDVDGQFNVPVTTYRQLDKTDGHLLFGRSLSPTFLSVLNFKGALGDPQVLHALQSSIDYQGIMTAVYKGAAAPLRAIVPPAAWGYAPETFEAGYDELPEPVQDLDAARKLVEESDRASKPIVLAYNTTSGEETKTATAIADAANSVGLNVELKPMTGEEYNGIFSSAETRQGLDMFLVTGYLDFPDPVTYYQYFTIGSFYNFNGYANKEYSQFIGAALVEPDEQRKADDIVQAQKLMAEDLVNLPILTQYIAVFYGKRLGGYLPSQSYVYTPWLAELSGA